MISRTDPEADGGRAEEVPTNREPEPETGMDRAHPDREVEHVIDVHEGGRASSSGSGETYARVIRPTRAMTSSGMDDDKIADDGRHVGDDAAGSDGTEGSSSPWTCGLPPGVPDRQRDESAPDADEWQEMALQVGDDLDLDPDPVETEFRNSSPIPDYYDGDGGVRRAVTFTPDTKDNEGRSRRYPTEGISAGREDRPDWAAVTLPRQPTADPERGVSVSTDWRHYGTMASSGHGNARLYPGTATVLPPGSAAYGDPERGGVWITDTDTWRRNPDNTSVITIDASSERRSVTDPGQESGMTPFRIRHGSLNTTGSSTYPTMFVTSSAYGGSKSGLLVNGTNPNYLLPDDSDDIKVMEDFKYEKKKEIEKEENQKKCRIIGFAVVMCVIVAIFIGILVKFT